MSNGKANRSVTVANSQGLHLRPAGMISKVVSQHRSKVELIKDNLRVDGRSPLDIMTLGAPQGTILLIEAEGPDAETALEALAELFASKFGENDEENAQDS